MRTSFLLSPLYLISQPLQRTLQEETSAVHTKLVMLLKLMVSNALRLNRKLLKVDQTDCLPHAVELLIKAVPEKLQEYVFGFHKN